MTNAAAPSPESPRDLVERLEATLRATRATPPPGTRYMQIPITWYDASGTLFGVVRETAEHIRELQRERDQLEAKVSFLDPTERNQSSAAWKTWVHDFENRLDDLQRENERLRALMVTGSGTLTDEEASTLWSEVRKQLTPLERLMTSLPKEDRIAHADVAAVSVVEAVQKNAAVRLTSCQAEVERLRERETKLHKWTPERLAMHFHETYETLAPLHGYKTRDATAVPWDTVPDSNKSLMVAVAEQVLAAILQDQEQE